MEENIGCCELLSIFSSWGLLVASWGFVTEGISKQQSRA